MSCSVCVCVCVCVCVKERARERGREGGREDNSKRHDGLTHTCHTSMHMGQLALDTFWMHVWLPFTVTGKHKPHLPQWK